MHDKLQKKIEKFIEDTVVPAFSKVGEDLYQDGIKTKFTSKPWRNKIKEESSFHLFEVSLSQGGNQFCQISSYLSIKDESRIEFSSSIKKNYGSKTKSKIMVENIEKIDKNKLAEEILKKV